MVNSYQKNSFSCLHGESIADAMMMVMIMMTTMMMIISSTEEVSDQFKGIFLMLSWQSLITNVFRTI